MYLFFKEKLCGKQGLCCSGYMKKGGNVNHMIIFFSEKEKIILILTRSCRYNRRKCSTHIVDAVMSVELDILKAGKESSSISSIITAS